MERKEWRTVNDAAVVVAAMGSVTADEV